MTPAFKASLITLIRLGHYRGTKHRSAVHVVVNRPFAAKGHVTYPPIFKYVALCEHHKWKEQEKISRTAKFEVCSVGI